MHELEEMIHAGAMAFLRREYSIILIFAVVVFALLWFGINWQTSLAFLTGGICSAVTGFWGMTAATRANSQTAEAANKYGMAKALNVSYFGGAVMGTAVASLGLIDVHPLAGGSSRRPLGPGRCAGGLHPERCVPGPLHVQRRRRLG
jgi:K(+)-stimulated pyrophosphate-energized sodium pump